MKRAKVNLTTEDVERWLGLPEDMQVESLVYVPDRRILTVIIMGEGLNNNFKHIPGVEPGNFDWDLNDG